MTMIRLTNIAKWVDLKYVLMTMFKYYHTKFLPNIFKNYSVIVICVFFKFSFLWWPSYIRVSLSYPAVDVNLVTPL